MKILQRYILRELLFPLVMAMTIFTFILIMDKIFTLTDLIVKYGVSALTVLELLMDLLPATFAITVPMACLVAVIVAFARLKSDNEITAMKASGISLAPQAWVVVGFGLVLTLAMAVFDNHVLPAANYAYKNLYYQIISRRAAVVIREHVFVDDFDGYIFRVGEADPLSGDLKNIVVFTLGRQPQDSMSAIFAQRGRLITDDRSRRVMLKLEDGFMQMPMASDPQLYTRLEFQSDLLDLDIHHNLANPEPADLRSPREMSMGAIRREIRRGTTSGPDLNLLWVEYHKKLSIPFACLAFVLIGMPLGLLSPRSGKYLAYFIGVMLIFAYYIMLSLGETFSVDGRTQAWLAMWLPNIILSGLGVYGLAWVFAEQPPGFKRGAARRPS